MSDQRPSAAHVASPDLQAILDRLYALPPWWHGAAIALPDWPEHDPRWNILHELDTIHTAEHALEQLHAAVDADRRTIAQRHADQGVPRPLIASALGMTLSELREWMGWP